MVVRKLGPEERMGVIARIDGRTGVVEYSDLPDELAQQRDDEGELTYWAGSIAVHCIEVGVRRASSPRAGCACPTTGPSRRVPHVDADGRAVDPDEPNAVKFETFLFDALPQRRRSVTVEVRREDEFSPIKNAEGADSPATARRDLNRTVRALARGRRGRRAARRRRRAGRPRDRPALRARRGGARRAPPAGLEVTGPTVMPPAGA